MAPCLLMTSASATGLKHMASTEHKLQLCLNWIHKWSLETGLKILKLK